MPDAASPPRILLVDDEGSLLEGLAKAARTLGCDVDVASSGNQAWRRLSASDYDLVVTDLRMPGMGGSELLGRIEQARLPVRVIVITGYATLEAAVDCLRKGAVDFLVKPFDMEAFKASVSKALARSALGGPRGEPDWGAVALHYGLTKRQAEVLRAFYTTGKSNRELSKELCLSHHTVKSHLKAAFAKLAVASRAQLLRKLQDAS